MTEAVARAWAEPIRPPPWLPGAVAILAVLVTTLAVWVVTCGS